MIYRYIFISLYNKTRMQKELLCVDYVDTKIYSCIARFSVLLFADFKSYTAGMDIQILVW